MNFIPVSPVQLHEQLVMCLERGLVPMIWGPPGIGKSAIVQQATAEWLGKPIEYNTNFIDFRCNLHDPVDLVGVPSVQEGRTRWNPPNILPGLHPDHEERGVLNLEELPNAHRAMQSAAYPITYHPFRIGEYRLPDDWRIVLTGNRMEDGGGTYEMPTPLKNRLRHYELNVSIDDLVGYATQENWHPAVISYLQFKPNMMLQVDHQATAFPTLRTWEMVSDDIHFAGGNTPSMMQLQSTIGPGAAQDITEYLQSTVDLPSFQEMLDKPEIVRAFRNAMGMCYSIIANLVYEVGQIRKTHGDDEPTPGGKTAKKLDQVLAVVTELPDEFQMFFIKGVARVAPNFISGSYLKWVDDHNEFLS